VPVLRPRAQAPPDDAGLEESHHFRQFVGLLQHAMGSGSRLFDQRGILLGYFIYLGDRHVDLLDPHGLFLAGRGDLAHDVGHALDAVDDVAHGLAGVVGKSPVFRHY
jgi:hypothetical protein